MKEMQYEIEFKPVKNNRKTPCRFYQKPLEYLLKCCNEKARESREGYL